MTPDRFQSRMNPEVLEIACWRISRLLQVAAIREWPDAAHSMNAVAEECRKTAQEVELLYATFLELCATVLTGGVQALQLACNSDDTEEQRNIVALVRVAVSGLLRTNRAWFLNESEEPAHD